MKRSNQPPTSSKTIALALALVHRRIRAARKKLAVALMQAARPMLAVGGAPRGVARDARHIDGRRLRIDVEEAVVFVA